MLVSCRVVHRQTQPPLWERGIAPAKKTLIKIDIDAQPQRAVGRSDWLDVMPAGITSGLACQNAKFANSTPVMRPVTMLIGTTYGASLDLKAPFARKITNPKAKP